MNPEQTPKNPAAKTGLFATLSNLLRAKGTGAPSRPRATKTLAATFLAVTAAFMALTASPALAARGHVFSTTFGTPCPELEVPCGPGKLTEPAGLAVNEETGNVYVVDKGNDRVQYFTSAGAYLGQFDGSASPTTGQFAAPEGIAVDNSPASPSFGDVYVADVGHGVIDKFGPTGAYLGQLTGTCENPGELPAAGCPASSSAAVVPFSELLGLATDAKGQLWVYQASAEIDAFSGAEENEFLSRRNDPNPFAPSPGLAVDLGEHIYIQNGFGETKKLDSAGNLITKTFHVNPGPPAVAGQPVVNLSSNEVYIDAGEEGSIARLTSAGSLVETFGAGKVAAGTGIAVNANTGEVFVADSTADRVNVFVLEPPAPPTIESESASQVTSTSALLEAELNPRGLPTTYHFEYDTLEYPEAGPPHGTSVPAPPASAGSAFGSLSVALPIQGLTPGTTYHYRLVAENELDTAKGPDRSFTTESSLASTLLPDGRAWELVSPPEKHGISLEGLTVEGGLIEAAADGSGLAYIADGPIQTEVEGNRSVAPQQLLAQRRNGLWQTTDITTRHENPAGLFVGSLSEYQFFSDDLSRGFVRPAGSTPLAPQATEPTPYLREAATGTYVPLIYPGNVPPGTKWGGTETGSEDFSGAARFITATPDGRSAIVESKEPLTVGVPPGLGALYKWTEGTLTLASEVPTSPATTCGGTGPACVPTGASLGNNNEQVRGAVSDDGNRVIFGTELGTGLYLRDLASAETVQINAPQPGAEPGSGIFQLASGDGHRVFFTSGAKLTVDSTAKESEPDLYMCTVEVVGGKLSCALKDLTVDPNLGESADVQGMLIGASKTGQTVYFAANGALAPGAVQGKCEGGLSAGLSCNLYAYDVAAEQVHLVGVVSQRDSNDWVPNGGVDLGSLTARVSENGRWFSFMSRRPLTGFDNRDLLTGEPDQEVFLYDSATAALRCVSCAASGARPRGFFESLSSLIGPLVDRPQLWSEQGLAASIPGGPRLDLAHGLYLSRNLSDSGRLFFNAATPLVPQDSNGVEDVYQYEPPGVGGCTQASPDFGAASGGCVSLLSSGTSGEESAFLDASASGDDVFFLTQARLTPKDVDGALDVYDARVGGGEPEPVKPVECSGDACQQPAVPPNHPTPGTALLNGPGNLTKCPKGKVKKSGKCVKKHKAKKHHKKHKKSKRANSNRGGAK